jgi:L-alanine-DL-glutamate epimerase-like enolase superfamily enzyme
MSKPTDVRPTAVELYFLPIELRVPLKFGPETLTSVTCARVRMTVADAQGRCADGWGETPLSVAWVWPGDLPYETRHDRLKRFSVMMAEAWAGYREAGHPIEVGMGFQNEVMGSMLERFNEAHPAGESMPLLAALVCCSAFDLALHDAYGVLHDTSVYRTYGPDFMSRDLASFLEPAEAADVSFGGRYPDSFLTAQPPQSLRAWHLVGGVDPLKVSQLTGDEPDDGHPLILTDWIRRDGLKCIKIKLRGNDQAWDVQRIVEVGRIAVEHDVEWLSADFNCTVTDPQYVNEILDRLLHDEPRLYGMLLYVEQPFPYDLEAHRIDVHAVSARKPLFMDESAHDWKLVALGRRLGWTGVALKTCKTQTGALLSLCWARAHGMTLMVQDLTNPMLAQVPHVLLAAHAGTIMGVETNAMQYYPDASRPEAAVHPGLYVRRGGQIDLSTLRGAGFGYGTEKIRRELPAATACFG